MRDKVLLRVRLPATQSAYEFLVPYDVYVCQAARLIAEVLGRRNAGLYEASDDAALMMLETDDAGKLIDGDETIRSLVVAQVLVDGSAVALV